MAHARLLPFGECSVATVLPTGIVDVRVIDDRMSRTIASRMRIDELVDIASAVFENIEHNASNPQKDRDNAREVCEYIQAFKQSWRR